MSFCFAALIESLLRPILRWPRRPRRSIPKKRSARGYGKNNFLYKSSTVTTTASQRRSSFLVGQTAGVATPAEETVAIDTVHHERCRRGGPPSPAVRFGTNSSDHDPVTAPSLQSSPMRLQHDRLVIDRHQLTQLSVLATTFRCVHVFSYAETNFCRPSTIANQAQAADEANQPSRNANLEKRQRNLWRSVRLLFSMATATKPGIRNVLRPTGLGAAGRSRRNSDRPRGRVTEQTYGGAGSIEGLRGAD